MSQKIASFYAEITADTSKLQSGLQATQGGLKGLVSAFAPAIMQATSLAGAANLAAKFLRDSVRAAADSEMTMARLNTTLATTGRAAEISAAQIDNAASSLSRMSTFDDEAIINAYNSIAKFGSIDTKSMDSVVKTAMDMTAALGGDLAGNAEAVARALETGTIPRTWGFNDALKAQIQSQIEAGNSGQALKLTLDELGRRYGGQAAAALNTYTGSVERLKNSWENYTELLGSSSLLTLKGINNSLAEQADNATEAAGAVDKLTEAEQKRFLAAATGGNYAGANEVIQEYTYSLLEATNATGDMTRKGNDFNVVISDGAAALGDYVDKFSQVTDLAGQFTQSEQDLATAQEELATLRAQGWSETSTKVQGAKKAVEDLQAAQEKQTAAWMLGIIQQQLAVDGLTRKEMEYLLQYQVNTGLISEEASKRALAAWDSAMNIAAAYASIPDEIINVTTVFSQSGEAPSTIKHGGVSVTERAAGGPLYPGESYSVGEQGEEGLVWNGSGWHVVPSQQWAGMRHNAQGGFYAGGLITASDDPDRIPIPVSRGVYRGRTGTSEAPTLFYRNEWNTYPGQEASAAQYNASLYSSGVPVPTNGPTPYGLDSSPSSAAAASAASEAAAAASQVTASTQSVSEAAATISSSSTANVQATQQQTAMASQQNAALLSEVRGLRQDILTKIPKAIQDSYQKVVGQ